jgi:hypothetical protein
LAHVTYEWLFTYLERLGFEDSSQSDFERVFEHSELGIILAFSMLDDVAVDRPVRDADVTSVEFRLQQEGLLSGPLADVSPRLSEL